MSYDERWQEGSICTVPPCLVSDATENFDYIRSIGLGHMMKLANKVFGHARFIDSFEHGRLLLGHSKYRNLKISKRHLCALGR